MGRCRTVIAGVLLAGVVAGCGKDAREGLPDAPLPPPDKKARTKANPTPGITPPPSAQKASLGG